MSASVADALVSALAEDGIDTVVGIGGTHTMRLLGALERQGSLRFVPARTELGAAHIALGYAKATGRPAVVLTSTGPGCLNVTAALQDARWSSLPLLHITTSVVSAQGFAGLVHETPMQQFITGTAGKSTVAVVNNEVVGALRRSLELVRRRPCGPVTLEVPAGTWDNPAEPSQPDVGSGPEVEPQLDELVAALHRAARPLLFVGGGALGHTPDLTGPDPVLALAEKLQAPVLTSHQGKAVANWDHPLYLGPWASEPSVQKLCAQADLALVLGSKLSALGTGYHRLDLPERSWVIGPGSRHPNYPQLRRLDLDARAAATQLETRVEPKAPWADKGVAAVRHAVRDSVRARSGLELDFLEAIANSPEAPKLISADMCKAGFWVMKHLPVVTDAVHAFSSYLTMGTAVPMAIGLSLARDEPSLAVVGDGGLQMSLSELATMAELQVPVVVLVGVDGAYGMLRDNSAQVGGSADLGLTLWNPDFRQLALAFGIEAEEITTPADLGRALTQPTKGPRVLLASTPFSRNW